jgi:16S rRNA (guanine527-N7)-methyltransferase
MEASGHAARALNWDELPGLFPDFPAPGRWLGRLQSQARLIAEAAPAVRVTAANEPDAVRRHFAESLEILRLILRSGPIESLADVGSGGGFPGLVIASVLPGVTVHLIEPLGKRARLLGSIAQALGVENVTVHQVRAEDAGRGLLRDSCDVVTARALAGLSELLEYTAPLCVPGGRIVLPKGSGFEAELAAAQGAMTVLGCGLVTCEAMRSEISATLSVATFRKAGVTPATYPRRAGMPAKRPL